MLEALKRNYTLCATDGTALRTVRLYLSYTTYSTRETETGTENTLYYTAITGDRAVEEGMFLFDGARRYRVVSVNTGGAETILRLLRRVTFAYPISDGGTLDFIYRPLRESLGKDVLSGQGGVTLQLSVTERGEGICTLSGELIVRGATLGQAQAEALGVLEILYDLCEDEASPLLSVRRGAFRYEQDEAGNGFATKEILELCVKEGTESGT